MLICGSWRPVVVVVVVVNIVDVVDVVDVVDDDDDDIVVFVVVLSLKPSIKCLVKIGSIIDEILLLLFLF